MKFANGNTDAEHSRGLATRQIHIPGDALGSSIGKRLFHKKHSAANYVLEGSEFLALFHVLYEALLAVFTRYPPNAAPEWQAGCLWRRSREV